MKEQIKHFIQCTSGAIEPIESKDELLDRLEARYEFLLEEVMELREALDYRDVLSCVDAIGDIEVFHQQNVIDLESAGILYEDCCDSIAYNNNSKFSTNKAYIESKLLDFPVGYVYVNEVFNDNEYHYCLKDSFTHKVKKWRDYSSPNLTPFIPKEFRGE